MTSLSYGRIFRLDSHKIDGTYQRYNHYFRKILFIKLSFTNTLNILHRLFFETQGRKYGRNLSWSCYVLDDSIL